MIELIHPLHWNGRRYTKLDRDFVRLLVDFGAPAVFEALDQFQQTPTDHDRTAVLAYCESLEAAYV